MKRQLPLFLLSVIVLMGFASIYFFASPNKNPMSSHIDFLPLEAGDDYAENWRVVDSLTNQGLTKEALEMINKIYEKASADDNAPQIAKSVLHILSATQQVEDESAFLNFERMNTEINKAKFPLKQVLQSLLAEHYSSYYTNNAWRFSQRTETVELKEDDPRTWDLAKIDRASRELYLASIANEENLQRTDIYLFKAILDTEVGSGTYRPTLYDLLAHRALAFFGSETFGLTAPSYEFSLEGDAAFGTDAEFLSQDFASRDTMSHKRLSLLILQKLTKFHGGNPTSPAATFVTLERLDYVRQISTAPQKDEWYVKGLESLLNRSRGSSSEADVAFKLGSYWNDQGGFYNPLAGDAHKGDHSKALEIVQPYIGKPTSVGVNNCKELHTAIQRKSLEFQLENVSPINKPSLGLATYRNVETISFRIVAIGEELARDWTSMENSVLQERLSKLKVLLAWNVIPPKDKDFNQHSLEFGLPPLPQGRYALIAKHEACGNGYSDAFFAPFAVSDLAYTSRTLPGGPVEYIVTNRNNGAPIKGVKADVWEQTYDYQQSRYNWKKKEAYTSDENGSFIVSTTGTNYRSYYLEFSYNGTKILSTDNWYAYQNRPSADYVSKSTVFFTDRGIYRPGQTIYFKGILLANEKGKTSIRANARTTVQFHDVNSQLVAQLDLTSNEFGTVSGSFTAPQGQLNGQMSIFDNDGSTYFSVEDYKRPKFEVVMDPVKGSFRLNDKVQVSGKATAYAGSSVDGATVKYRVFRTATYPYCYWSWWRPRPSSPEMEIAHGTVITDPDGAFSLDFQAIPDKKVAPETKPQFNYQVKVDVVDITGETHSSSTNVSVGYIALAASVGVPAMLKAGTDQYLSLNTKNLNGEFEKAVGQIKVFQLKTPDVQYRGRQWNLPDKMVIPEAEFRKNFPHTPFLDENDQKNWAKQATVLDRGFDTEKSDSISLDKLTGWKPGAYKVEMSTKDKFGTPVTSEAYFSVYEAPSSTAPSAGVMQVHAEKSSVEPGAQASFVVMVGEDDTQVLMEVERKGVVAKKEWMKLKKGSHRIEIPVDENDRGNFSVHFLSIRHGELFAITQTVFVPWSNKELKLEFGTFRSKLWPGQKEEWTMKVAGPKGEKVAAEMLAGMYDASLDAFRSVNWALNVNPTYYSSLSWAKGAVFGLASSVASNYDDYYTSFQFQGYDRFSSIYQMNSYGYYENRRSYSREEGEMDGFAADDIAVDKEASVNTGISAKPAPAPMMSGGKSKSANTAELASEGPSGGDGKDQAPVQVRTNLQETAFFFPQLRTNENGEVLISFTIPEALTRWRFMAMAHTQDLKTAMTERSIVTQKDLMVMPNPPRFFRENDNITFSAKVSNLSEGDLSGNATLEMFDALTMKPVNLDLGLSNNSVNFTAKKGQSALVEWNLKIPSTLQAVTYRVIAKAGAFSDGEEASLPVLTNSMLVTETLPLPVRSKQTKTFVLDKLANNKSTTLRNHKLTLEFTSNPAWYAIQALPYMMEYPYECAEQAFSRYYANSIATHIANSSPRIKQVFDSWASSGSKESLMSNLEKNQELKALMLEETPWVMDAQNESERKKRVGLLFDLNRMANEQKSALAKVEKAQVSNGAWPWFPGMPESRYITQHIVAGMGHLDRLGVKSLREDKSSWNMVQKAVGYLDRVLRDDLERLKRDKVDLKKQQLYNDNIHLLYARSFFKDLPVSNGCEEAYAYYLGQAKTFWLSFERYTQGMIALVLNRAGETTTAKGIIKSLDQNAMRSEEMGMYWKDSQWGMYWYQAPIETQALLIEAFSEVTGDKAAVEEMKLWLLKQKQTQDWKTTKATAEACYALLLNGTDLLSQSQIAEVSVGGERIDPSTRPDMKVEAGTGYFMTSWSGAEIKPAMAKVTVKNPNEVAAWGALYWQYFEQLDKITFAKTNIQVGKGLFLEQDTDTGPKLIPMVPGKAFKPGDKVKVRIILSTDRDMEYVHLKDMRASGFEPINVISSYRYQDGLGYYQSTRDAATNFFIDYLRKGTYVFEYALRATHQGDFSNGITTLQCMYAPEFTAHSEGVRVQIAK